MQSKHILGLAVAAASVAGAAFAGTPAPVAVAPAKACPLSGSVYAGYATNYTFRGIVMSHSIVEGDSVIPVGANVNYQVNDNNAVVFGASYQAVTSGHTYFGATNGAPAYNMENETDINIGWQNKNGLLNNLTTTVGYNLMHGGLAGFFAKYNQDAAHSLAQEFYVNLNYDITDHVFAGVTTSYAFQGLTGWWFQPYVGYKTSLCSCTDLVVTAGMSASSSYIPRSVPGFNNGAQAFWVKLEAPVKLGVQSLALVPFVSFNWAGCGVVDANEAARGFWPNKTNYPFKNFGVVAGASLVYSF